MSVLVTVDPPEGFFQGFRRDALRTIIGVLEPDEMKWVQAESAVSNTTSHLLCVDLSTHAVRSLLFAAEVDQAAEVELREPHRMTVAHYVPRLEIAGSVVLGAATMQSRKRTIASPSLPISSRT